jgi:hypothetical protein
MRVELMISNGNARSRIVADAMANGIPKYGDQVKVIREEFYNGPECDVAAFYGLYGNCKQAFMDYRRTGKKAVYIDLGYWERTQGGKLYGYHKVAVNARHPTAYFMKRPMPMTRFKQLGLEVKPWRREGTHILIAGMGAKAAAVEGFAPNQWEITALRELRKHSDRPVIYRPKPSWRSPEKIDGTTFSPNSQPLADVLDDCWATVSHHSNVCVDGLIEGIPTFCYHGVGSVMGLQELSKIEDPIYPDGREQWAANIAWTQWRPDEMEGGHAWRYLRDEGIV